MAILRETQKERDLELSGILNKSLKYIQGIEICTPDSIRIFNEKGTIELEKDFLSLYKEYNYLDWDAYLKTLMYTSVERRGPVLKKLLMSTEHKKCLDFGSGVGTHAVALLENTNEVTILDVKGPLLDFAEKRIIRRGFKVDILYNDSILLEEKYDVIICADVLEHVYDPLKEFEKIYLSIKQGGRLFLEVSKMVKPSSGHFIRSINLWNKKGTVILKKLFKSINKDLYIKK